jgi:hypothetical protein
MSEFNWVKARHDCCVGTAFEQLKAQVRDDVQTREDLRPKTEQHQHYAFKFSSLGSDSFAASMEGNKIHKAVTFRLESKTIVITKPDQTETKITVGLNNEGRCTIKIGGTEYENWQARKLVLDELFFGAA